MGVHARWHLKHPVVDPTLAVGVLPHSPWQVVTVEVDYLPPITPLTGPTFALPFSIERDVR
jgi:hypothetical protein